MSVILFSFKYHGDLLDWIFFFYIDNQLFQSYLVRASRTQTAKFNNVLYDREMCFSGRSTQLQLYMKWKTLTFVLFSFSISFVFFYFYFHSISFYFVSFFLSFFSPLSLLFACCCGLFYFCIANSFSPLISLLFCAVRLLRLLRLL